jgi:hypothetical protein
MIYGFWNLSVQKWSGSDRKVIPICSKLVPRPKTATGLDHMPVSEGEMVLELDVFDAKETQMPADRRHRLSRAKRETRWRF